MSRGLGTWFTRAFLVFVILFAVMLSLITLPAAAQESRVVEVEVGDFYFSPRIINVSEGQEIILRVTNTGDYPHTLTIDGLGVDVNVGPGETVEVSFTALDAGEYEVYCRYHPRMTGVIRVNPMVVGSVTVVETTTVTTTVFRVITPPTTTVTHTVTQLAQPQTITVTFTQTLAPTTVTVTRTLTVTQAPEEQGSDGALLLLTALIALVAGVSVGRLSTGRGRSS